MEWRLVKKHKETKNQSWPLPLSTAVFSWVEEAADVGKQGCNTQHGDANDVGVGAHVAKRTLTAASCLHLHGRCAQKDCFSGVLPAALGVVPTKQSIVEQARAKSTQASTRELERAMS